MNDATALNRRLSGLYLASDTIPDAMLNDVLAYAKDAKARCVNALASIKDETRWTWRNSWYLADCLGAELADRLDRSPKLSNCPATGQMDSQVSKCPEMGQGISFSQNVRRWGPLRGCGL